MARRRDSRLEKLIDQAAVDTDDEAGVAMGLCYAMQEHVKFPFPGKVVGEEVTVEGVEEGEGTEVVALCRRKGRTYRVRLDDVRIKERPRGAEWFDAYLKFRGNR
jgi:hypothetical protein